LAAQPPVGASIVYDARMDRGLCGRRMGVPNGGTSTR